MRESFTIEDEEQYLAFEEIEFSIIFHKLKMLPFFVDDLYLGMQAINVGLVDALITEKEYALLDEFIEIEKTPIESALMVSALSQMWIFGLYEVLRLWRDRKYEFEKLKINGGAKCKIDAMKDDDPLNLTLETRKAQLIRYNEDKNYRDEIQTTWDKLEPVYRMVELLRINFAKHAAPGKDAMLPRAPGYGRIDMLCGSMGYELIERDGNYTYLNRRDVADALRSSLSQD